MMIWPVVAQRGNFDLGWAVANMIFLIEYGLGRLWQVAGFVM